MRDRRPDRIAALTDVIANSQLDGLLLSSPANIRYLTGFSGSSALVFVTARREVAASEQTLIPMNLESA